jgi:hypothetical protein
MNEGHASRGAKHGWVGDEQGMKRVALAVKRHGGKCGAKHPATAAGAVGRRARIPNSHILVPALAPARNAADKRAARLEAGDVLADPARANSTRGCCATPLRPTNVSWHGLPLTLVLPASRAIFIGDSAICLFPSDGL